MPRLCSKGIPGYNSSTDINYIESQIQEILFIIGINESNIDELTIDSIIEKIRDIFKYDTKTMRLGPDMFIKSINIHLVANIRRLWYWLHFAKQVS